MTLVNRELAAMGDRHRTETKVLISAVVPVLNAMRYLPQTVPSILDSAASTPAVQIIYVDNGSTDGSYEYLISLATRGIQVFRLVPGTAGAIRNFGARQAQGDFLSFVDADCLIANNYFRDALTVLRTTRAAATGCEYEAPPAPHWIEAAWHDLHYVGREREVTYLPAGNFFISRQVFDSIGGFREDLPSGEDAEIGQRLTKGGYRIHESPRVGAVHLGNPKSIRDFYRRAVWHALGMFGTVDRRHIDKPTAMMCLHLLATIAGLAVLLRAPLGWPSRVLIALLLQLAIPGTTIGYRVWQTKRAARLGRGILLYWIYYWARVQALALVLLGKGHSYMK